MIQRFASSRVPVAQLRNIDKKKKLIDVRRQTAQKNIEEHQIAHFREKKAVAKWFAEFFEFFVAKELLEVVGLC